jgi:hypothetical protein
MQCRVAISSRKSIPPRRLRRWPSSSETPRETIRRFRYAAGGGLGDLAIRYGYQRFETAVMVDVVIVLIVLVSGIQWLGDRLVARLDHR